ncbi:hypothetical protein KIN20_035229 [Parelaphostrongylus tenuis]|uniref:Uncharacterized protein n=1 Tax=Parelaphostrongylus tenuis TaxID=148309 RepID=A0AAD5RBF9_PARTN|nr:hypothetical protein KIN20_035229 [Parelaphostrongylus tenuis]
MKEFLRDENELMSCQVKSFRENRLRCEELGCLSIRDQTDLIFRILKDIRGEMSGFFKSLYVVSDTHCPVIRFYSYDRHMVELSVNNGIGYQKSFYIGTVIHADQSGLLQKLVLGLRFWAMSNGVFTSEKKKTWNLNSYTFTLMFFVFLQYKGLLPIFSYSDVEEYINGIRVDFVVPRYTLAQVDIRRIFKVRIFFVFCVDNPLEKLVFSMRNGRLTPLDEIKEEWNSKPNSVLFVQDNEARNDVVVSSDEAKCRFIRGHVTGTTDELHQQALLRRQTFHQWMARAQSPDYQRILMNVRLKGCCLSFSHQCYVATIFLLRRRELVSIAKLLISGIFVVSKKLWMSRRTLRKKWSSLLGKDEQFPLLIESLVTTSLDETTQNDCCLQFQTFFELYNDTLWVGFKLIEGDTVDIGNLAHFTEQLLTKLRDFFSSNNTGVTMSILDDYTSLVRRIFERDRTRLKL